jgi:hypothetical protein
MKSFAMVAMTASIFALTNPTPVRAQGYVDQAAVATLLNTQGTEATARPVKWHVYKIPSAHKNSKAIEKGLRAHLDSLPGGMDGHRLKIVELTNRVRAAYLAQRHALLVPNEFPEDFRAYAPYPLHYPGGDSLSKLFIVDKSTQTFAAYERGKLVRWGLVSTGSSDDLTPGGRYTFNWQQEYRLSTAAPEGEVWEMRWVWNFHGPKGIHVHQYAVPIAQAASHGCVRLTEADARWNYDWAEKGTTVLVLGVSPVGLVSHWMYSGGEATPLVYLPSSPMDVPLGVPGAKEKDVALRD